MNWHKSEVNPTNFCFLFQSLKCWITCESNVVYCETEKPNNKNRQKMCESVKKVCDSIGSRLPCYRSKDVTQDKLEWIGFLLHFGRWEAARLGWTVEAWQGGRGNAWWLFLNINSTKAFRQRFQHSINMT